MSGKPRRNKYVDPPKKLLDRFNEMILILIFLTGLYFGVRFIVSLFQR
jgi:hypothetical protein